jgi:rod shape determining protein RodA
MSNAKLWRHFDFLLLGAVAALVIFGVAIIRSATFEVESLVELVPRQIIYAGAGLVMIFLLAWLDYRLWNSLAPAGYAIMILLLLALFFIGLVRHGASRWIDVGVAELQPSEAGKILIILALARFLEGHRHELDRFKWVAYSMIYVGIPAVLIFLQPDLSTSILFAVLWLAMLWAAGLKLKHIGLFALVGLALPLLLWPFMQDYMRARVVQFIYPEVDAAAKYNVDQALISVGSGGLFGQGYGHASQVQLRFLRVRHTDFIFSTIAAQFGFVGATALIGVMFFVVYRILRAARMARDTFGALLCYGVATMIFYQAAFNIGMNLNMLPVAGLPLPFISYGGSNLLTFLVGIGLVESVVLRHKQIEF